MWHSQRKIILLRDASVKGCNSMGQACRYHTWRPVMIYDGSWSTTAGLGYRFLFLPVPLSLMSKKPRKARKSKESSKIIESINSPLSTCPHPISTCSKNNLSALPSGSPFFFITPFLNTHSPLDSLSLKARWHPLSSYPRYILHTTSPST